MKKIIDPHYEELHEFNFDEILTDNNGIPFRGIIIISDGKNIMSKKQYHLHSYYLNDRGDKVFRCTLI